MTMHSHPSSSKSMQLLVDVSAQMLHYTAKNGVILRSFCVSTASSGLGEQHGSWQTPRGRHIIRAKIGTNLPARAVLVGRRWTGEIYSAELGAAEPNRDWILSRILWLSGVEVGYNRLGKVDTMRRYIYLHGTADEDSLGLPVSKGCIRMGNDDIIELFGLVDVGSSVVIEG